MIPDSGFAILPPGSGPAIQISDLAFPTCVSYVFRRVPKFRRFLHACNRRPPKKWTTPRTSLPRPTSRTNGRPQEKLVDCFSDVRPTFDVEGATYFVSCDIALFMVNKCGWHFSGRTFPGQQKQVALGPRSCFTFMAIGHDTFVVF